MNICILREKPIRVIAIEKEEAGSLNLLFQFS